ncbi:hypothetical protein [Streptomyces sp. ME19-01-6]|uniref:hypothetical protein n=1 Tax=Streptomyces sp. ME19-01-6 TaxID=3028686 RepID=UPI0029AA2989|nr:hypothetical protein [Streptomyces sp. ME19-01-6]MDX3224304.1 hypothetical protein [Streptomyces sp. ME19-01-6]
MSFDEEWAQLKAAAQEEHSAAGRSSGMRLNQLDGGGGGGLVTPYGGLCTSPAQKKTAAGVIEDELEPGLTKAGDDADTKSNTAISEFHGWDTAAGLKHVLTEWQTQVKALTKRIGGEKEALRGTNTLFTGTDLHTGSSFCGIFGPQTNGTSANGGSQPSLPLPLTSSHP